MGDPEVLGYAAPSGRVSALAVTAMAVGVAGVLTCVTILPAVAALMLGVAAEALIFASRGKLRGVGFARSGIALGIIGLFLGVGIDTLFPLLRFPSGGGYSNRGQCAANLRGLAQSMIVYAAENDEWFPTVAYAPYSAALNSPTAAATATTADDALATYYGPAKAQAGSVAACAWILVLRDQLAPKSLICPSDPFASGPARRTDAAGAYYDNFQNPRQLSYSLAYPWKADGSVGEWWHNTSDSSQPVAADAAPEQGTGSPPRNLTLPAPPALPATWNSVNHQGDGQNVAFADGHAEFWRRPDMGQGHDNIWTTSAAPSTAPAQFGGIAASRSTGPALTADKAPFDLVMYPVRNASTGL